MRRGGVSMRLVGNDERLSDVARRKGGAIGLALPPFRSATYPSSIRDWPRTGLRYSPKFRGGDAQPAFWVARSA